jgi:lipoprotein-anchoring transpeptidase ErfK/SrfK
VNTEVTAAAVCVLALGAAAAGFAKERDTHTAADAPVAEPAGEFAGASGVVADGATRAARHSARSARVHAVGGTVATIRRGASVRLYASPGGRRLAVLGDRTPFGSPAALAVVRRRGGWLGVTSSVLANGRVAWIRSGSDSVKLTPNEVRLVVDRSERRLDLLRGSRRLMSVPVGVGRPGSETPTGRFAVTDKLSGGRYRGAYGCCILALSGRQTNLPPGWRGGDRLAIHGTTGRGGSAGCVTVERVPLERLMRAVPLGTVVTIRA